MDPEHFSWGSSCKASYSQTKGTPCPRTGDLGPELIIPIKWEQSTKSSFWSWVWGGLHFPVFAFGLPDGMHQNLNVFLSGLENITVGTSVCQVFVSWLIMATLHRQHWEISTFGSITWLREWPRRTCAHSCHWRANKRRSLAEIKVKRAPR